jgi:cell fate regulator YaaT (PSP1 superfamily)
MRTTNVQIKNRYTVYTCDATEGNYKIDDVVMVDTRDEGIQLGKVISEPRERNADIFAEPVRKVLRVATDADLQKMEDERKKAAEALKACKQKIEKLHLPMKLVDVGFRAGGEKITFYFIAESRVNFRELVKQLASELHTRIEMRQIGARNEAKMKGGVGCCGRPICCASFLPDFEPVTIRMAKEQGLSLDPTKISGLCGRLLCCLGYEAETYSELSKGLPKVGSRVMTAYGEGKVSKVNVIAQAALIELEDRRQVSVKVDELKKVRK